MTTKGDTSMSNPEPSRVAPGARLRVRDFGPLAGFVIPTLVIGYGYVIPNSCIAGINPLTIGFAGTVLGACVTYVVGVRGALRR
jgi:hypothetical protein